MALSLHFRREKNGAFPLPSMASTPRDAIPGGGKGEGTEFALFRDGDTATEEDCRDLKPLLRCFKLSTCRPPPVSPSRTARLRTVESQLREGGQRATRQVIAKMCRTMRGNSAGIGLRNDDCGFLIEESHSKLNNPKSAFIDLQENRGWRVTVNY